MQTIQMVILMATLFFLSHAQSTKKGLCVGKNNFDCGDLGLFQNISWYYNWGAEFHGSSCSSPSPPPGYIPMVWGCWGSVQGDLPSSLPTILGFNEPDHTNQANMTPERAADCWVLLQEAYPDRVLVGPATSLKPDGEMTWLDEFMAICEGLGCRMDYIAVHRYGGTGEAIMKMLDDLYKRHGKKIWLTEFAKSGTSSADKALEFMQEILPMLEEHEGIHKYSWFENRYPANKTGCPNPGGWCLDKANSLLEVDMAGQPTLTELGQFYNQFGK